MRFLICGRNWLDHATHFDPTRLKSGSSHLDPSGDGAFYACFQSGHLHGGGVCLSDHWQLMVLMLAGSAFGSSAGRFYVTPSLNNAAYGLSSGL